MALGRGLSSLIPSKPNKVEIKRNVVANTVNGVPGNAILEVDINKIIPNPEQPRKNFESVALKELSQSIKDKGILQPLVVTELGNGGYELVAGERRFQASKMAGLQKVPVVITKAKTNAEKLELALIENIQRRDLNPIEKASSFKRLQDEFNLTQEEVAKRLGKNRPSIANTLRLLDLPEKIQQAIKEERISEGHARSLVAVKDSQKQDMLFKAILNDKLSVRNTEEAVKKVKVQTHKRSIGVSDPDAKDLENRLIELLGTKVSVKKTGKKGKIVIEFYSDEELNNIVNKIK